MIRMQPDLSEATAQEKETLLTLPHVASAIDSLSHLKRNDVKLVLIVNHQDQSYRLASDERSTDEDLILPLCGY